MKNKFRQVPPYPKIRHVKVKNPTNSVLYARLSYGDVTRTFGARNGPNMLSLFFAKLAWALEDMKVPTQLVECPNCSEKMPAARLAKHQEKECQAATDTSSREDQL